MGKGKNTKEFIIEQAAELFNKNGYAGASISELMHVTGLKKGGIYNHFPSKEDIILDAFNYSVKKYNYAIYAVYKDKESAIDKLLAIINFYKTYALKPVIDGGCPVINTAVDADNTQPVLKKRVRQVIEKWLNNLQEIIENGQESGEIQADITPRQAAVFILTTIQGGILLARTLETNATMEITIKQLVQYVNTNLKS